MNITRSNSTNQFDIENILNKQYDDMNKTINELYKPKLTYTETIIYKF